MICIIPHFIVIQEPHLGWIREYRLKGGTELEVVEGGEPINKTEGKIRKDVYLRYFAPPKEKSPPPKRKASKKTQPETEIRYGTDRPR